MANKLGQLRVVPKPQREHVAGATEDDGFPPTEVLEIMPSNHGDQLALFSSWFGPPLCGAITLFHQTSVRCWHAWVSLVWCNLRNNLIRTHDGVRSFGSKRG